MFLPLLTSRMHTDVMMVWWLSIGCIGRVACNVRITSPLKLNWQGIKYKKKLIVLCSFCTDVKQYLFSVHIFSKRSFFTLFSSISQFRCWEPAFSITSMNISTNTTKKKSQKNTSGTPQLEKCRRSETVFFFNFSKS